MAQSLSLNLQSFHLARDLPTSQEHCLEMGIVHEMVPWCFSPDSYDTVDEKQSRTGETVKKHVFGGVLSISTGSRDFLHQQYHLRYRTLTKNSIGFLPISTGCITRLRM